MGRYDNFNNNKNIEKAQKKLDKLTAKRKQDLYKIDLAQNELNIAKMFETCQIFKGVSDYAPNTSCLFSDDNEVMLFVDKLIYYKDIQSYKIIENIISESHTTTKQKGTVSRAIVGGIIAGGVGSVVGAMSAGSTSDTTYCNRGNGFFFQIFLKDGNGYQWFVQNNGIISNKIHPLWLEMGSKIEKIIETYNK